MITPSLVGARVDTRQAAPRLVEPSFLNYAEMSKTLIYILLFFGAGADKRKRDQSNTKFVRKLQSRLNSTPVFIRGKSLCVTGTSSQEISLSAKYFVNF